MGVGSGARELLMQTKDPPALNPGPGSTMTFQEEGGGDDKQPISTLEEDTQMASTPSCHLSSE